MNRDLTQLADIEFDLVVVGGGIHGACIAWDAALRGLHVALIEKGDFGQETSANSLKTVHGGLRYLQDADINLVRMMIRERTKYLNIAPHLVHLLPCMTPTYSRVMKSRMVMALALKLNDIAGFDRNNSSDPGKYIPPSELLSQKKCLEVLPGLQNERITGAARWHDAQIYDTERLTLSFVTSSVKAGATAVNYVKASGFIKSEDRVVGIEARDTLSGERFVIKSKVVVNSAGPWVDEVLGGMNFKSMQKRFNHSLAINLVTTKLIDEYAVGVPSWTNESKTDSGDEPVSHMLFISPWRDRSLIGTFHTHYQGSPDDFKLDAELLGEVLQEANSAYPGAALEVEDISFIHAGFLPEKNRSMSGEVKLIRKGRVIDHRSEDKIHGLITVVGVKYTTARKVAEEAVNLVFNQLGINPPGNATAHTQLHDGQMEDFNIFLSQAMDRDRSIIAPAAIDHLVRSYGSEYQSIRKLITVNDKRDQIGVNSSEILRAQIMYALKKEMAVKLTDFIMRRSGIGSIGKPNEELLQLCANIMAEELNWDKNKREQEIKEVKSKYDQFTMKETNQS